MVSVTHLYFFFVFNVFYVFISTLKPKPHTMNLEPRNCVLSVMFGRPAARTRDTGTTEPEADLAENIKISLVLAMFTEAEERALETQDLTDLEADVVVFETQVKG